MVRAVVAVLSLIAAILTQMIGEGTVDTEMVETTVYTVVNAVLATALYLWSRKQEEKMTQLPIDLPPSDDELFGNTTCGWSGCNNTVKQSEAIPACVDNGHSTIQEHFCSNRCRDKWRDELPVRYQEH